MIQQETAQHRPADWSVRFLCGCKKNGSEFKLHQGVAQQISPQGMNILSQHPICNSRRLAMQLLIPARNNRPAPQQIIKVIGNSISTVEKGSVFQTTIEFLFFEENGKNVLESNLYPDTESYNQAVYALRSDPAGENLNLRRAS